MSSGSSGHNVTVPEPWCSILFLMRRMVAGDYKQVPVEDLAWCGSWVYNRTVIIS